MDANVSRQQPNINPLEIHSTIVQIFDGYQNEEDFYHSLLEFVATLTNPRGVFLLELRNKQVKIMAQQLVEKENAHWQLVRKAIVKSVEKYSGKEAHVGNLSLRGRQWYFAIAPISTTKKFLCLVVELEDEEQLTPFILILQLIAGYIPFAHIGELAQKKEIVAERVAVAMELVNHAIREGDLYKSSQNVVEKLQKYLRCQYVAMGLIKNWGSRLIAISDSKKFDRRSNFVKKIEAAMQEAVREKRTILYPLPKDSHTLQVDVAHKELKIQTACDYIITVPMFNDKEQVFAVWMFLWEDLAPQQHDMNLIETITPHVADVMFLLRNTRGNLMMRSAKKCVAVMQRLKTWVIIAAVCATLWGTQLPWNHYVRAKSQVVPLKRHSVAAPFAGILQSAFCKPGDFVKRNQLLAKLDDRELRLEYIALQQSLAATDKKLSLLFAQEQMADYHIAKVEKKKNEQRLQLLEYRLGHLEIRAPHSGILLQGDLQDFIGTPVSLGEVLFEVASISDLVIEMSVDERDVGYVRLDCPAELRVDAYPDKVWNSTVRYIAPSSEIKDGENIFVCEMNMGNKHEKLLPGMRGEVKILVGEEPLWWLWLHRPIAWFKTKVWW
ncbi:efflux RND transporter periplasmic adaptor subunit [Candidatus Uabimicrobium amorphum]|uniref:Hemolysin D n=1 Tax=Uabimicrobium amorphum TaxID=2596890 RepID=A0A5S9IQF9_UABAM|nr:efflux RND transporter periplasmic adaptor subunit [Candidatus Uabimicrobium amorphum]BBM85280.1 hemolysin D [Candidatus Uabimicrobium amorphum]